MSSLSIKFPYRKKNTTNYGGIWTPKITISIKEVLGFEPITLLVDSGADVSMLPKSWAKRLGLKLKDLPSHEVLTASGRETTAYRASIVIKLSEDSKEITIPWTFTASNKIPPLLGRTGIFDKLTIEFSHHQKATLLKK